MRGRPGLAICPYKVIREKKLSQDTCVRAGSCTRVDNEESSPVIARCSAQDASYGLDSINARGEEPSSSTYVRKTPDSQKGRQSK